MPYIGLKSGQWNFWTPSMVIRYSISASANEIEQRFSANVSPGYAPRYNAAPTHLLPVITNDSRGGLSFFYWGAPPSLANQKPLSEKIINTRAESFHEKQVARKKLREKRCLIPADGFFAWKRTGKKTSIPYRFIPKGKELIAFAGLWEEYDDEHGEMIHTFSVITCPANTLVALTTERMPVILSPDFESKWLDGGSEDELISGLQFSIDLDSYPVSSRVNLPEKNDKTIILPAPAADQFGNLSLFD